MCVNAARDVIIGLPLRSRPTPRVLYIMRRRGGQDVIHVSSYLMRPGLVAHLWIGVTRLGRRLLGGQRASDTWHALCPIGSMHSRFPLLCLGGGGGGDRVLRQLQRIRRRRDDRLFSRASNLCLARGL